jgi:hypothetical protein
LLFGKTIFGVKEKLLDIIGLIKDREHFRRMMRIETDPRKKAEYKRQFRRARNKINWIKEGRI